EVLTQEFALRFVRGSFSRAHKDRGRFRDFLKTALQNLATDHHRQQRQRLDPLPAAADQLAAPRPDAWPSDEEFLQHWRQALLDSAWEVLQQAESETAPPFYRVLRWRAEYPDGRAADLAQQLSSELGRAFTEAGIRQILKRAREKFADLLLEEGGRSLETSESERIEKGLLDLDLLIYCQS